MNGRWGEPSEGVERRGSEELTKKLKIGDFLRLRVYICRVCKVQPFCQCFLKE